MVCNSKFSKIQIPTALSDSIGYHVKCYKNYTAVSQDEIKAATGKLSEQSSEAQLQVVVENIQPTPGLESGSRDIQCVGFENIKLLKSKSNPKNLRIWIGFPNVGKGIQEETKTNHEEVVHEDVVAHENVAAHEDVVPQAMGKPFELQILLILHLLKTFLKKMKNVYY
ncbi:hypothetical protein OUZ56_009850 [Daphnia magna]|uniref:Uncharacterized protein n=1 Tax=Daphnia magna TaxID=35525 RepID=A0ABR0AH90_9CRUS|nr:hypothetical protein OUZ56_009850 [Daphnia magna]